MRTGSKSLDIYCLTDRRVVEVLLSLSLITTWGCYETADVLQTTSLHFEERCASISARPAPEKVGGSVGERSKPCQSAKILIILPVTTEGENMAKSSHCGSEMEEAGDDQPDRVPLSRQMENRPEPENGVRGSAPAKTSIVCQRHCGCWKKELARQEQYLQTINDKLNLMLNLWRR